MDPPEQAGEGAAGMHWGLMHWDELDCAVLRAQHDPSTCSLAGFGVLRAQFPWKSACWEPDATLPNGSAREGQEQQHQALSRCLCPSLARALVAMGEMTL